MKGLERIEVADLDAVDFIRLTGKRTSKYIAIALGEIEEVLDKSSPEYEFIRKSVIDNMNDLKRAILRLVIGDVETGYPGGI